MITVIETYGVQGQDSHSDHEKKMLIILLVFNIDHFIDVKGGWVGGLRGDGYT